MTTLRDSALREVAGELAVARLAATEATVRDVAFGCLQELDRILDFDWSIIVAYGPTQDTILAAFPFPVAGLGAGNTIGPEHRVAGPMIRTDLLLQADASTYIGLAGIPLWGLRSSIAVPLLPSGASARGAVHLFSRHADSFTPSDVFTVHRIVQSLYRRLAATSDGGEHSPDANSVHSDTGQHRHDELHHLARELAHRINNPLATIVGYAELLPSLEAEQRAAATAVIETEALRAANVLQRLMEVAAAPPTMVETLDLTSLLLPALAGCVNKVPTLAFELIPQPRAPRVRANRDQLTRALNHIMDNICAALTGEDHPTLAVSLTSSSRAVQVTFRDNRPGVSQAFLATAFDVFANPSSAPNVPQDALPAAYGLIRANSGTLRAEALNEGGLLLVLELPTAETTDIPPQ